MKEFQLIAALTAGLPGNASVKTGAGDDCAVLDLGIPGRDLLFKTDAVVEGVHFLRDTPPEKIGHKALARCLSDIAAMGGVPSSAVITIGVGGGFPAESILKIYEGLNATAARYGVAIVGGETTTSPERFFLSVALLGWVEQGQAILRSGAKVGDAIFVTGQLGGSLAGKHLDFTPRLAEGRWLLEHFPPHAMLDLSDGLAGDIRHILRGSHIGAEILATAVPISREAKLKTRSESSAKPPLLAALTDGEDFELLFTLPGAKAVPLLDGWKKQFPDTPLTCIGKISATPGLRLRSKEGVRSLGETGYEHTA